jgi:site-specific DNA-methyltransferase (cytosine-N4-specific)
MKAVIKGSTRKMAEAGSGIKNNDSFEAACVLKVEDRNMRNVWTFPTQSYREAHFATFPEELPRRCIRAATRPGDVVLDPFAGSGTVGKVAIELNRKAILNDLAYQDFAEKRTKNVQRCLI